MAQRVDKEFAKIKKINGMGIKMGIILASQSPRRCELLKEIERQFQTIPCTAEEVIPEGLSAAEAVMHLAQQKAEWVSQRHPDDLVIGADTVVSINGKILGKPKDKQDCISMLEMLSGKVHQVYTGVSFVGKGKTVVFYETTEVEFYPLSPEEIQWYSNTEEPYDKAGSYGIQGKGSLLVKGIHGDYFNVMGFPVAAIWRRWKAFKAEVSARA